MAETETSPDEPAHDVLAAEEFPMPAPDPDLHHHGPVVLPDDPTGIAEPHDILAAEEFPMPAGRPGPLVSKTGPRRRGLIAVALVGVVTVWRLRRSRRGAG